MASVKPLNSKGKIMLNQITKVSFLKSVIEARNSEGDHILDFEFKKTRCNLLSSCEDIKEGATSVLYWMWRDCRIQDNWAMLFAQRLALKHQLPLFVCFYWDQSALYPTLRQLKFLIDGLEFVRDECRKLKIGFYFINSSPLSLVELVRRNNVGCVVTDFYPLREVAEFKEKIIRDLPDIPFVEVDAHNIVPAWVAADTQMLAARTLRPKIQNKLAEYLTGFPPVIKHPHSGKLDVNSVSNYGDVFKKFKPKIDVEPVSWAQPGPDAGLEMLRVFITENLEHYSAKKDLSDKSQSNLAPWLNFGHISAQRCALEVQNLNILKTQTDDFLEQLIIRKELSDNYCHYNKNYDNFKGADAWAQTTLNEHRKDKRKYIYTEAQFKDALTHDPIWNAAQTQLVKQGKLHGYMRMYWCKKILEWTDSPEKAIEIGLWLNDTFSLDGSDPNGYVGVMWSICGVHDHGWKERAVFGKIRFMVDYMMSRKFNMEPYMALYGQPVDNIDNNNKGKRKRK